MSSEPSTIQPLSGAVGQTQTITIISHSNLFYWWPVWAIGFIMWAISYFGRGRMAVVPIGTKPVTAIEYEGKQHAALVFPDTKYASGYLDEPKLHVASGRNYGVLWVAVLLMVIVITNVPLRGMSSFVVILVSVFLVIIFWLADLWEPILRTLSLLDIRINAGGYLVVSGLLFVAWLLTTFIFDHQMYIQFTPGNFKVCTEIGGGERVYDTAGIKLERQRSDLFRHWILGLGSGDLVVKTTGAQADHFDLPNVLFINRKVQQIERMTRTKQVVETK